MTPNERLTRIRESTGLSMRKFAERIGVSVSTISLIEKGERDVQVPMAKAISKEFGISETWLLEGIGDMNIPLARDKEIGRIAASLYNADDMPWLVPIVNNITKLTIDDWEKIFSIAQTLIDIKNDSEN